MSDFSFSLPESDAELSSLRAEVQQFLRDGLEDGVYRREPECWMTSSDPQFSRRLGQKGWIGMTWDPVYGGQGKSALHRYVVTEECLRAGAPVGAHWIADRQSAPLILELGDEEQKSIILPSIARGETYFAIGLSEPGAGSDLANVKTKAEQQSDGKKNEEAGWLLNGGKIWSSGAHIAHYMIALVRTSPPEGRNRHIGLSQFLVDLSLPGVTVKPILDQSGDMHFNEVLFEDVLLPANALLGPLGGGWKQVTGELALERSGPERLLSTYTTLEAALELIHGRASHASRARIARLFARLRVLRTMSFSIAALLEQGIKPETEAALLKDLGNRTEREITSEVRQMLNDIPPREWEESEEAIQMARIINSGILRGVTNSLRGGTSEVMRGIIARQIGLR